MMLVLAGACQSSDVSRALGARCATDSDCDEKCLEPSADWPGGFCTLICDTDDDCPGGSRCTTEDDGVCEISCGSDADCAYLGAYTCVAYDSKGGGTKVMVCRGD